MSDVIISESKLEDMLYNHFSGDHYSDNIAEFFSGDLVLKAERQLDIGNYGIADIVIFKDPEPDGLIDVEIYELKKDVIDKSSLIQILKYKVGIKKYAELYDLKIGEISLNLIGGRISQENLFEFVPQAINDLEIYTYDICPDNGLTFKSEDSWKFKELKKPKKLINILTCLSYVGYDQNCGWYHNEKIQVK